MAAAGLTSLFVAPQFDSFVHRLPIALSQVLAVLDREEIEIWIEAVGAAGEAFFMSKPMHAAVGTRPPT